jgi:hypothetical protein
MISYCIAIYRPAYARLLLADLARKTAVPFEILIWLNVADALLEADIAEAVARGIPMRVIGRTPENIGMCAYASLFRAARHPLITQIDDDVVCISRGAAERAHRVFQRFPTVRQIVADVWQDEHTTGARPLLEHYQVFDAGELLFNGPIDGWFSIYHQSILPMLVSLPYAQYLALGATLHGRLLSRGQLGVLDRGMKVFHVIGPAYANAFGMLNFEIEKYRRLGRFDVVDWYESYRADEVSPASLAARIDAIRASLDSKLATGPVGLVS